MSVAMDAHDAAQTTKQSHDAEFAEAAVGESPDTFEADETCPLTVTSSYA